MRTVGELAGGALFAAVPKGRSPHLYVDFVVADAVRR